MFKAVDNILKALLLLILGDNLKAAKSQIVK